MRDDAALRLESGDEKKVLSIVRGGEEAEETYLWAERACSSPFCPCAAVTLTLHPVSETARARWRRREAIDVDLDPFEQRRVLEGSDQVTREEREFGRWLALHLSDSHWAALRESFLHAKAEAMRTFDPDRSARDFPFREIEEDGLMVAYPEVFPFGEAIDFGHDGHMFRLDDQYCVKSGCECSNAVLAFIPIGAGRGRQCTRSFFLDYGKLRWTDERTGKPPTGEALRLTRTVENDAGLLSSLRARHALLRQVYRASKTATHSTATPRPETPGRNVPCPCGSGKKFKRCCGVTA